MFTDFQKPQRYKQNNKTTAPFRGGFFDVSGGRLTVKSIQTETARHRPKRWTVCLTKRRFLGDEKNSVQMSRCYHVCSWL